MEAIAAVMEAPGDLAIRTLELTAPASGDVVVDIDWSSVSTGTERLLWSGRMPPFPGMGYPLVPGYEAAGRIVETGQNSQHRVGDFVFVPGANCYRDVRGLFGAAASRIVTGADRVVAVDRNLGADATLLALAATAYHAIQIGSGGRDTKGLPDLIIGHGVLGRLIARVTMALGGPPPTVWERQQHRMSGAVGYEVVAPEADEVRQYHSICDASGDAGVLDAIIPRLARGGQIVLAGFYEQRVGFDFVPAFLREARILIAAEWQPGDLAAVSELVGCGRLSLADLISHRAAAADAASAYPTAFTESSCLKLVLDWRGNP